MSSSFNQQFDQHGAWRLRFAKRLNALSGWLQTHDLLDQAVAERMSELEAQLRTSKVMVAFVAEFSRGKSELINAIFFAGYGRRIMPASAGRTTMCPTELSYDPGKAPSLQLLPIETRLEPRSLVHWRNEPDRWTHVPIDVSDAEELSRAMGKVAEVSWVPLAQARALGFWNDGAPEDNPLPDSEGRVEIPRWRHAVLNMPHPLLEQGLVILDTPGLNAIGAEPELTVSLIPQAHAVVFILGADTGVTRSDLSIWREHLITEGDPARRGDTRIVVLNKIDTMWDTLSTPAQTDSQIERQRKGAADLLGVPLAHVLPVSAQKGLQAKIRRDAPLLEASRLSALESVLGAGLLGKRETMLRLAVDAGIDALRAEAARIIGVRQRDLSEQALELQGLRGKNVSVIKHMRVRIEQEQDEFENSNTRILALRSVQGKLLREVYSVLGTTALRSDMGKLASALKRPGIKLSVRKVYGETFDALRNNLREVQTTTAEIQAMLHATFRQLNAEHGFTLKAPAEPDLVGFQQELSDIEKSHIHYLGVGNMLKLAQADFCDKLVRALASRLRVVNEAAMTEVERWSKGAAAQLDAQLKERRRNFGRRIESVERIQGAAGSLEERLAELAEQEASIAGLNERLNEQVALLNASEAADTTDGSDDQFADSPSDAPADRRDGLDPARGWVNAPETYGTAGAH